MKTLKVKSIFFSLLAIMMVSVFLTSCEQAIVEQVEPTLTNDAVLKAVLDASKGKLTEDAGTYVIQLSQDDLSVDIYDAIMDKQGLTVTEGFTISAQDVEEIFCLSGNECPIQGEQVLSYQEIALGASAGVTNRNTCIPIWITPYFWVFVCFT